MLLGCFPARRDFPARQRGCLVSRVHQEWQELAFQPLRQQLAPVLAALSLSPSGEEPSPSPEQLLGDPKMFWGAAGFARSLFTPLWLQLVPWICPHAGFWGGDDSVCSLICSFGSVFGDAQHLARCSSLQHKACATCCHPGRDGTEMSLCCVEGTLPTLGTAKVGTWGHIQGGAEAGASQGAGAGARLALAASQPCRALFLWELFQQHDCPGPRPSAVPVSPTARAGGSGASAVPWLLLVPQGGLSATLWGLLPCQIISAGRASLVPLPGPCRG